MFAFMAMFAAAFAVPGMAEALNGTTAGTATAVSADGGITVSADYTDDTNANNTLTVEWGIADYSMGTQTVVHAASPYAYTIPGLTNGTAYRVRVTYLDADGIIGGVAVQTFTNVIPSNQLIHNSATTRSTKWGGLWGVAGGKYGEFTCETCHEKNAVNIKMLKSNITAPNSPTDAFPGSALSATDARDGSSDFGNDAVAHTTSTKVCEVCHTQTTFHRYNTAGQASLDHNNARDCARCHRHGVGFRSSGCATCHGNPPIDNSSLVGYLYPSSTGSTTAGAHNKHVTGKGIACESCHSGSVGTGATHDAGSVTVGFSLFSGAYTGGAYDGQTTVTYNATGTTTVTATGQAKCSNLYCHSNASPLNGVNAYAQPVWSGAATACNSCHSAPADGTKTWSSSHTKHTADYGYTCDSCHSLTAGSNTTIIDQSKHVNNVKDIAIAATYGGTYALGQCSNVYCHGNGDGGVGAVTPAWTVTAMTCGSCHAATPATGSHSAHTSSFNCSLCHNATTTNGTTIADKTKHVNKVKDIAFDVNYGGTYTAGVGCSATYCHDPSGASVVSPAWGGTLPDVAQCDSCHGGNKTSTNAAGRGPIVTGAHTAHINNSDANLGSFGCGKCHYNTVADGNDRTITGAAFHVNKAVDVPVTCTTACHKDGHGTAVAPPAWTSGTNLTCKGCHGAATSSFGEPDYATGNSHAKHVLAASDCGKCHNSTSTTGTSITGALHLNGVSNVVMSATYGGSYLAGTGCSATYCHDPSNIGTVSPAWGGALADSAQCDSCHGGNKASTNVAGSGPIATGAHTAHINNTDANLGSFACGKCHYNTVAETDDRTITGAAFHVNTVKDVPVNCTTACHKDGHGTAVAPPTWASGLTLSCKGCHGSATSSFGEPDYATGNSHSKHVSAASDCGKCHNSTSTNGTSITGALHLNSVSNVVMSATYGGTYTAGVGCSATYCHDPSGASVASPAWGGTLADAAQCDSCHGGNKSATAVAGQGPITTGAHTAHINNADANLGSFGCGKCHYSTVTDGDDRTITGASFHVNTVKDVPVTCTTACHKDGHGTAVAPPTWTSGLTITCKGCHGSATSSFGEPDYATGNSHSKHVSAASDCGKCHNSTSTNGTSITGALHLNSVSNVVMSSTYGGTYTTGVGCSATYCHDPSNIGSTSPAWGGTLADSAECDSCHGGNKTSTNVAGNGPIATGAHTAHINNADANLGSFGCGKCHYDTVTDGNDRLITGLAHVNASVDAPVNCTTACHKDGHGTAVAPPTWASGLTLSCKGCHGSTSSSFGEPDYVGGNSHSSHVGAASDCSKCHNSTTTTGTSITGALHLNSASNVNFATGYGGIYTAGVGCSATYCHDPSNAGVASPAWGGTLSDVAQCDSCHGGNAASTSVAGRGPMATGSHTTHVAGQSFDCANCHSATVTLGNDRLVTGAANHVNKVTNVAFSAGGSYAGSQCSNISCHSDGKGNYINPTWGGTSTGCDFCHGNPPATGVHAKHVKTGASAYGSTAVAYDANGWINAGCGNCHPTSASSHRNGSVDTSLAAADGGTLKSKNGAGAAYTPATGKCSNVYCHSNGYDTNLVYALTPDWNNSTGTSCDSCHGNSPNSTIPGSSSHFNTFVRSDGQTVGKGHFVGIHFTSIYTGTTGLASAGNTAAGSHGNSTTAYTISCYTCHNDTVSVAANAGNNVCGTCHTNGGPQVGDTLATLKAGSISHINGQVDIVFQSAALKSKAQLRDESLPASWTRNVGYKVAGANDSAVSALAPTAYNSSTKTCTVACHNEQPVTWTSSVSCSSCHTGL
ncbi:MAG: CxxxxCH/CxxCH domain-containing protein [Nitrospirae bacterium]|nr:CxxxxCH/CxxCH domain-containing protein [Nitrospirota bacterium]